MSAGQSIAEIHSCDWPKESFQRKRIENYFSRLLSFRLDTVADEAIVTGIWPTSLELTELPFSTRVKNLIGQEAIPSSGQDLIDMTFGELMSVSSMGPRSVLDIASTMELAMQNSQLSLPLVGISVSDGERKEVISRIVRESGDIPLDEISAGDPRFRDVVPLGSGTLADRLDQLSMVADQNLFAKEALALFEALPLIRARAEELASAPLDKALHRLFAEFSGLKGERFNALIARFGWAGKAPLTLEESGQLLDVTRERIRQIQNRILGKLPEHTIFLPQLRRALVMLESFVPSKIDVAALYLKQEGITEKTFDPRSVIAAAADCGIECSIRIQTVRGEKLVVSKKQKAAAEALMKYARKQAGASGATNVSEVVEQVAQEGFEITNKKALRLLRSHKKVSFLTEDWFWFPEITIARNRLRNVSRRMLAVTSTLKISDIRGGLRRVYSFRNSTGTARSWPLRVPPSQVLTEFFKQHPEFSIDEDGNAVSAEKLDYRKELGPAEQIFVDAIRSTPTSLLDRQSLLRECRDRGLKDNSFSVITTYSPILSHVDLNIWTLRGIDVNPAAVEALRSVNALRPRERRLQDYGWTTEGNIWIATRIPEVYESYVCGCPGALLRFLKGRRFDAIGEDGLSYGTIAFSEGHGTSYGYNPFLQRVGAEQGDILISEFDLSAESATLRIGDLELLDAMDPN
jgi:hypothetical protein